MNIQKHYQSQRERRKRRTRAQIHGTLLRPRLSVHRSLRFISAQLIDDAHGQTLAATNDRNITGTKMKRATAVGKLIAEMAKQNNIHSVVFDRGAYRYHGRVKALAESAREQGLQF